MGDYVWPEELGLTDQEKYERKWGDRPSVGNSSSPSDDSPPKNNDSGGRTRRSPAPTTASRSNPAQAGRSTAASTAGSGRGTG